MLQFHNRLIDPCHFADKLAQLPMQITDTKTNKSEHAELYFNAQHLEI